MHYCTPFTPRQTTDLSPTLTLSLSVSLPAGSSDRAARDVPRGGQRPTNRRYNCRTIRTAFLPNRQTAITVARELSHVAESSMVCNFAAGRDLYNARPAAMHSARPPKSRRCRQCFAMLSFVRVDALWFTTVERKTKVKCASVQAILIQATTATTLVIYNSVSVSRSACNSFVLLIFRNTDAVLPHDRLSQYTRNITRSKSVYF